MLRHLVWLLGLWISVSGCILTPEIEEETGEVLYAPEILLITLSPRDSGLITLDKACSPAIFKVGQVRERNKSEKLFYGWLFDWDPEVQTQPDSGWLAIGNDREEVRVGPQTQRDLELDFDNQVHTIKIFIADRFPKGLVGDGVEFFEDDPGQYDSCDWTYVVKDGEGICADGGSGT